MNENPSRSRRTASFGILAAATLISGCVVGPDFQKPDVPTPEGWLETAEASISTDAGDHRDWWKSFNDPALEALIQEAYEGNQALEIAGLRVYEAHAQLGFAKGTLYPQIMSARLSGDNIELSETAEPVFFAGYSIEPGAIHRPVTPYDIAVTLTAVLGSKPPSGAIGQPLSEVVNPRVAD